MLRFLTIGLGLLLAGCNLSTTPELLPVVTPDLPQIEILSPSNNRQIIEQIVFEIDVVAQDRSSGVARIELLIDGESFNQATPEDRIMVETFRAVFNWRAPASGRYLIEAVAYRADGTASDPASITVEVLPRE